MARKSRIGLPDATVHVPAAQTVFPTAVYARLSSEDREALSLDNQILMVSNYVEAAPDLSLCGVFSDNGLTGTNFNRPGFESLMDEVRSGRINCIVVKDLSRFGRDYVEAGNFLEVIFPCLGVRFISIGDGFDSFDPRCKGEGISIALKNMINAFYAKDISAKIKSAYDVKRSKGEFVGKCAPYGYLKAPDNKNRLVVDAEATETVREIFAMARDGINVVKIARSLTDRGIPNPGHYRYIRGIQKEKRYMEPQAWDHTVVKDILENVVYLGHLALGKTKTVGGKQYDVPRDEWVIAKDAHEPVISQADFDAAAALLRQARERIDGQNRHQREELPENLLDGLAFCADCGRAYRRVTNTMRDHVTYRITYICLHCNQNSPKYTYRHFRQDELYNALYVILRNECILYAKLRDRADAFRASPGARRQKSEREVSMAGIRRLLDRFPAKRKTLYDDYCEGILSKEDYSLLKQNYEAEENALAAELAALTERAEKLEPEYAGASQWSSAAERFISEGKLTREMLVAMVKRIEIQGDRSIQVDFNYRDEYERFYEFVEESEAGA
jgi:DNA invertase Pin-like site-specific DNA recombinase